MSERFPDVDWYCDECDEYLNEQSGFSDQNDCWICTDCGYENSISAGAILSEEAVTRAIDFLKSFDPKKYSG